MQRRKRLKNDTKEIQKGKKESKRKYMKKIQVLFCLISKSSPQPQSRINRFQRTKNH